MGILIHVISGIVYDFWEHEMGLYNSKELWQPE